ncbi:hypothetical protein [Paludifilum halophilum]|uniref:Uncharacterized protein n=1 Tax=Paludifilum halophilum TaxID=1642702 RepID=A0A235BAC2_9BACL|nr:hypothetical protein [Paludifilum halophilum]OYD08929.1 hypothetical protein CHM34_03885 [Paludifilum halophilum]
MFKKRKGRRKKTGKDVLIDVNADPTSQSAAATASNAGNNFLAAGGDIEFKQTASESGRGRQKVFQS